MSADNRAVPSRGETAVILAVVMLGALGVNHLTTSTTEKAEHRERAMLAHVAERGCVVAHEAAVTSATPYVRTTSLVPKLYRCDRPTANEYVESATLQAEALAHHP